jgi:hypothetical protein
MESLPNLGLASYGTERLRNLAGKQECDFGFALGVMEDKLTERHRTTSRTLV